MDILKNMLLNNIIDGNTLQDIQDKFAKLTHIPAITVDLYGNPITKLSNFTPLCKLIRSSSKGLKKCRECDAKGGLKSMKSGTPIIYSCHIGLTDLAAPIIVDNCFLGTILSGQVLIKGKQNKKDINLKKISDEYNIPLNALTDAIKHTQFVEYDHLQDSIDFLSLVANHIAQIGLNRLSQEKLLKETEEKIKLEEMANAMHLKTIKAQINPHFLFNTLNIITRMALIEDAPKTEELLYKLSDLLRYSLKNLDEFPKIKTEIDSIEKYLFIQTARYIDRIKFEIKISNSLNNYRIPTMTLQPIVENCIIHGLESKIDGGKITITGDFISENNIVIQVSDNGKGMDSNRLHILNNIENKSDNNLGIGIQSTHNRLKHYFGEKYGLKIESTINKGTTVYINIPCIK